MVTHKERFKLTPAVYVLFLKDDKFLLSHRINTGFEDGKYGLVSGHMEGLETAKQAAIREAREEAGVEIEANELELVLTMHRWSVDHERLDLFFVTKKWKNEIDNKEPDKCDELEWFSFINLPGNIIPYIREAIAAYIGGNHYLEFGWDNR